MTEPPSKHVPDDQLERLLGFVQQQGEREATEESLQPETFSLEVEVKEFCTRHGIELEEEK